MGGKSQSEPQSSQELARIAGELFNQTDPVRQALINNSLGFLGVRRVETQQPQQAQPPVVSSGRRIRFGMRGGRGDDQVDQISQPQPQPTSPSVSYEFGAPTFDVTQLPQYGAMKQAAEAQYGRARDNLISSSPGGGALTSALSRLENERASAMTGIVGNLADQETSRAFSLATGTVPQVIGGLGQAGAIQAQIGANNASQNAAAKQGLGLAAGGYLGGK